MPEQKEFRDGDFATFEEFSKANPAWSKRSLQWLRFNDEKNGLAKAGAFIKNGKRVLIFRQAFFAWVAAGGK